MLWRKHLTTLVDTHQSRDVAIQLIIYLNFILVPNCCCQSKLHESSLVQVSICMFSSYFSKLTRTVYHSFNSCPPSLHRRQSFGYPTCTNTHGYFHHFKSCALLELLPLPFFNSPSSVFFFLISFSISFLHQNGHQMQFQS